MTNVISTMRLPAVNRAIADHLLVVEAQPVMLAQATCHVALSGAA